MGNRHGPIIQRESTRKRVMDQGRIRLLCVALVFVFSFGAISVRLIEVSLLKGGSEEEASAGHLASHQQQGARADIVDRNGEVLATSLMTGSLFANPKLIHNPGEVARRLAKIFPDQNVDELRKKLASDTSYIWIKRNLTPAQQREVNTLGVPGLDFKNEERRVYPHGPLLAHVMGYVGIDNRGLAGIEKSFDDRLRGKTGDTQPLQLAIDLRVQNVMNDELKRGMMEFSALGAVGVLMDIDTGELLAMSSLPSFDPNRPGNAKDPSRFNRATLGVYEMGSTFKTFTMAMGLDYGIVGMRDGYDASHPIKVANFVIRDTHPKNRWLSVPEIFAYSSNIGTVKMILDVGMDRQKEFLTKLGMMKKVAIELPEVAHPLYPKQWHQINMMTISYGHGISVTPLHVIQGVSALAGDGHVKPITLIKGGNVNRKEGDAVIKAQTVSKIRQLLRLVVEHGTGGKADVSGYRVGGKTGTAEKISGGTYHANANLTSFISVFPVDDPKYALLVMLDEPKGNKATYGFATSGWNSVPVAGKIITRVAPMLGVRPIYDLPSDNIPLEAYEAKNSVHDVSY